MAAASTDKFRKGARKWVGQIGAGGVSDDTTTTIPLSSATNLPTDTAVDVIIDRVDSSGTKTPSLEETVTGVVSGSNLVTCIRGVEGTAQAHLAGAVVEVLWTNSTSSALIDGILVEHNQDGTHKEALVTTLKATGAVVTTGTSDVTIVTPKALKDAGIVASTPALTDYANLNLAEGQMINGKIVPSVASDNLTVALKTNSGADPSAASPVYVMIGGTLRSVTAALTVLPAGTVAGYNEFNAGSAELATKEIDYFVYLGVKTSTGAIYMYMSRIPYATLMTDLSSTFTASNYSGSNLNEADILVNIGRFAATLSAGAGYTWTVPTFTAANLIQRPIYETRELTWQPAYTGSGSLTYGTVTTTFATYRVIGNLCWIFLSTDGTTGGSTSSTIYATTPFSAARNTVMPAKIYDGATLLGIGTMDTTKVGVNNYNNANWGLGSSRAIYVAGAFNI